MPNEEGPSREAPRGASLRESSQDAKLESAAVDTKAVPREVSLGRTAAKLGAAVGTQDPAAQSPAKDTGPGFDQLQALPTGGDKTGVTSKAISLPQGSGKVQGMGESFSAQLSTGVASFSVPFALPHARGGAQPALGLSYSSSGGFGLAGVGWDVGVPFIARQTDRGIPNYDDRAGYHANQDHFVFNGGQELVPICVVTAGACTGAPDETMPSWSAGAQYFRPRVEGSYLRFFWSADHRTWRVQDKSGVTMELGVPLDGSNDTGALETNPSHPEQIYRWHLVRQYDAQGVANPAGPLMVATPNNVVVYRYFQRDNAAYLSDIFDTTPAASPQTTDTSQFAHHTRLSYEQRSDPTSSYRSGWRMDQTLRLSRVDVTSKTFNGAVNTARHQVRRYHLAYASQHASLLTSVQVEGRCTGAEAGAPAETSGPPDLGALAAHATELLPDLTSCDSLPAMTFDYSHVKENADLPGFEGFNEELRSVQSSPPHSVDEELTDLLDINSDGLPDVINTSVGTYGYGHGIFLNSVGGKADSFGSASLMTVQGVLSANANDITFRNLNLVPLDLNGDGTIDLLHMPQVKTYSMYTPTFANGAWSWKGSVVSTASGQNPKIDFGKDTTNTKVMDVNGDGLVDVVVSTGTEYQTFFSLGRLPQGDGQFGNGSWSSATVGNLSNEPIRTCVPWSATPVQLSDPDVQLADMNGDGLPDIVRVRRGDIRYWPGRGNGVWGTGEPSDCTKGTFSSNGFIFMAGPQYSDIDGTSLRMDDVNGDGLDDLVQVRYDAVDIWLNVDGKSWTDRHIIAGTPKSPSYANRVRLVDVNGSGTRDILWATAKSYQYIDLEDGQKSFLLTHVENGLGKSTDIEYTTSTAEMLAADSLRKCDLAADAQLLATNPWVCAWTIKMPTVAYMVKRVTDSDNLPVAGAAAGKYITEYQYRDPLFEGRQREFRGFTRARSKRIGDVNSPSDYTESAFLLGECEDETPGDGLDDCSLSERWRDNPREALKGLPIFTEKYDEKGAYLSTDSSTYRLRELFLGLDGRRVRQAFESAKKTVVYDTGAGAATGATASGVTTVELELTKPPTIWTPVDNQLMHPGVPTLGESTTPTRTSLIPLRASNGAVVITSASDVDYAGNKLVGFSFGCLGSTTCPPQDPDNGLVQDETIVQVTRPALVAANTGGWLWRTTESWVTGSVHQTARNHTHVAYDAFGNPTTTTAELSGAVELDRVAAGSVPAPTGASATGSGLHTIFVSSNAYDGLGLLTQESGANDRCRDVSYGSDVYAELATSETIHTNGGCAGAATLSTAAAYDRGLGAPTQVVDMQLQPTSVVYDAFGRLSELYRPKPDASATSATASVRVTYALPSAANPVKYSVIHAETLDGTSDSDASYLESYSYVDGLGRTVVSLAEADTNANDGGAFVVSGIQFYDAKGAVARKYLPSFYNGDAAHFALSLAPTDTPYGRQRYDAFGRQLQTFDLDGTVTLQSVYHALSSDLYDAADLENGPHQGTYASTRSDSHGRTIATTERIHVNGAIEAREVRTQYLATGEPEVITRVHVGKTDAPVVRWMRYDTLGHLVLNVEPNTTQNFTTDRTVSDAPSPTGIKAWRYAYNDAGDLVGTSDARGCGENFAYDGAGRLLTEDFIPCGQPTPYSLPVDATLADPTGYEVVYHYDSAPTQPFSSATGVTRPPSYTTTSSNYLKGRLVAVWSRGKAQWNSYDGRGRVVQTSVLPALPVDVTTRIAPNALTSRYGAHWYYRDFQYDAADREVLATTGSSVAQLQGSALVTGGPTSAIATTYSHRGTVKNVDSTYGELVTSITRTADGLVSDIVYKDAAQTTTHSDFDARRRLRNVQTYRGPPSLWGSTSNYTPLPAPTGPPSTFQLVLQDQQLTYDVVGNPTEIRDYRSPDEWPAGAKPLTKKIQYDDLYRATRIDYQAAGGTDVWTSPFAPELAGLSDPRRAMPGTHVAFASRPLFQTFSYDWLGNTRTSDDDSHGFYDRSLGGIVNDTEHTKPYQLVSASNKTSGTTPTNGGSFGAVYDAAGNLTRANLERLGSCLPAGSPCSARLQFYWDEVGRLSRAFRVDAAFASLPALGADALSTAGQKANLDFQYDESDERIIKTSTNASGVSSSTLYPYETLEVRGTEITPGSNPPDTTLSSDNEVPYLVAHGVRLARVAYEPTAKGEPRLGAAPGDSLHVLLEMGDHLGSTDIVIDKATSELVEASTYQGYGAKESDYRPERWQGYRDDYGFTGKEEDAEFGIVYFGKRFYSPYLNRWLSADPLAVHAAGSADLNIYAYVKGSVLRAIDPRGLTSFEIPAEGNIPAPPTLQSEPDGVGVTHITEVVITGTTVQKSQLGAARYGTQGKIEGPDLVGAAKGFYGTTLDGAESGLKYLSPIGWGYQAFGGSINFQSLKLSIKPNEESGAFFGGGAAMVVPVPIEEAADLAKGLKLLEPSLLAARDTLVATEEIAGAGKPVLKAPFNPTGSMKNCVNGVCAFLNSVNSGSLKTASADVAENLGSIRTALSQVEAQTGSQVGRAGQWNALRTGFDRQFFLVFRGSNVAVSDHVAVGIVNNGRSLIYDPQTGERFWNLADFGSFTAYPVKP